MVVVLSVAALRAHLLASGLAGTVANTREQSLNRYRLFAARDPRVLTGLSPDRDWSLPEVLALMAERCGVSPDPARVDGHDRIDPDRTVAGLDAFAERLAAAARNRAPVLFGTGHPDRLLGFYAALASALAAAGCPVLTPGAGRSVDMPTPYGVSRHRLCYVRGVACVRPERPPAAQNPPAAQSPPPAQAPPAVAEPYAPATYSPRAETPAAHSHSPLPVRTALAAAVTERGRLPELVVGDHGWVCAAGQLGIEAMGPADTDDPAPFVGQAEGRVSVAVPIDDGVSAAHYGPVARYVLNRARLSR